MKILQTKSLSLKQKQTLFELWNSEYPIKIGYSEISEFEDYLEALLNKNNYLLVADENVILGWAFTFDREGENWFSIILNSKTHRKGFGTLLLNEIKKNNSILNGWVIDHQNEIKKNKEPYISPIEFYIKNKFTVVTNRRIENDVISAVKIRWEKQ